MAPISSQIGQAVETWVANLRGSALAALARSGGLTARGLAAYLVSLRYLLSESEPSLLLATQRSRELRLPQLATYFATKTEEERGHERWVDDDLQTLSDVARAQLEPARHIRQLVDLQRRLIAHHPICFVAYVLWAEYFTALIGPDWLAAVAQSGFHPGQLSSVARHVEADRHHAAEGVREIDRLWTGEPPAHEILTAVAEASRIFDGFCNEVCDISSRMS